ncbi:hypothetical protein [Aminipila sp.]|nr:hypothetical protein [Aminipila sp.]
MKGITYDVIGLALLAVLILTFVIGKNSDSIQGILTSIAHSNVSKLGSLM